MNIEKANLIIINEISSDEKELFETILENGDVKVERIVTLKPYEKPGKWYDQDLDEWVLLLQGEAELEFENREIIAMKKGDYMFIPAHTLHRVHKTSTAPLCIWLALFGKFK